MSIIDGTPAEAPVADEYEIPVVSETIESAIEETARGRVKKLAEEDREIEYLSISDQIEADRYLAIKKAARARNGNFGLRMTKCIPPGGG